MERNLTEKTSNAGNDEKRSQAPELWFDVRGFEGKYEVSTLGRIRSYCRKGEPRILKPSLNRTNGYLYVCIGGKPTAVHRVVADSLLFNTRNVPHVHHRNENKTENTVFNLMFVTARENLNSGTRNERIAAAHKGVPRYAVMKPVVEVNDKGVVIALYGSLAEASKRTGISLGYLSVACRKYGKKPHGRMFWYAEEWYAMKADEVPPCVPQRKRKAAEAE